MHACELRARNWTFAATLAVVVPAFGLPTAPAYAIPAFQKAWEATYADPDAPDALPSSTDLALKVKEAKCNLCHFGKSRKNNNDYSLALGSLLDRKDFDGKRLRDEPEAVEAEIRAALKQVEAMPCPAGGTYGERISAGLLPGTVEQEAE